MKPTMRTYLFLLITLFTFTGVQAQNTDQQLAQHYYSNGEFDKALMYYDKLFGENQSKFNFTRYVECLVQTGDVKQAEKSYKRQINQNETDQEYKILFAKFYEGQDDFNKADAIYRKLIDELAGNSTDIDQLYNAFKAQGKMDLAFEALEKGRKLLKKSYPLNYHFADYYYLKGDTEKMMNEYLDLIDFHSSYRSDVQRILSRQIDFNDEESKEYTYLKNALLTRTQKNPNDDNYSEMLIWLFIQRQNFGAAFVQVRALDKRNDAAGRNVYELGRICVENKDYQTAKRCFQSVVDDGKDGPYFIRAQNAVLNVRFLQVTTMRDYSAEELQETLEAYDQALERVGLYYGSLPLIIEKAHIQAFYANQAPEAMISLEGALEIPRLSDIQRAEIKMQLADIRVLHGDIWDAALMYSQVDKDFKFEPIGHEAKFKSARIFYYDGEFDFAQSQLDVLKQSTSRLIANDALKLSLLITDNFGLDSNYTAMTWFANADLLIEQHRYEEAYSLFDSIIEQFPAHSLGDEILLKKAHSMQLKGEWTKAVEVLQELLKFHGEDILADDALFELGDIYQNNLLDPEKAKEYYMQILFNHKDSLYGEEARKRVQQMRGDDSGLIEFTEEKPELEEL
ncbi:MAG: tetratricopeptide (TPR) repeat protein [Crocinitomicaceae bacterium]|jgi:tetratricopeptide (TPR) repeat protein